MEKSFCLKCKDIVEYKAEITSTANGNKIKKGACPKCDTPIRKVVKKVKAKKTRIEAV